MTARDVSVVIPTRDRSSLVQRAVTSALHQVSVTVEVIVVDDGSSDDTSERVAARREDRVRVIRNHTSLGQAHARNQGIADARGEWIAFLDDDDLWSPDKLARQVAAARAAEASWVYTGAVVVDSALRVLTLRPAPDPRTIARDLLVTNPVPGGCSGVLAPAAVVRAVGGFDERLDHLTDWDLWIRLAAAGTSAACPAPLVAYMVHSANRVVAAGGDVGRELSYLSRKHAALSAAHGTHFNGLESARWVASGHWRAGRRRRAVRELAAAVVRHPRPANIALLARQVGRRARIGSGADPDDVAAGWLDAFRAGDERR